MKTLKFYAGIGSRKTPAEVCSRMTRLARTLRSADYIMRSGGAKNADTAFAAGAGTDAVIYLPFADCDILETGAKRIVCGDDPRLRAIAAGLHPAWQACDAFARAMLTRNVAQIIGHEPEDPVSEFVVCWTPFGAGGGGTGGALRVAKERGVPIYDLAQIGSYETLLDRLVAQEMLQRV
jgi:hypothetical protein